MRPPRHAGLGRWFGLSRSHGNQFGIALLGGYARGLQRMPARTLGWHVWHIGRVRLFKQDDKPAA